LVPGGVTIRVPAEGVLPAYFDGTGIMIINYFFQPNGNTWISLIQNAAHY